MVPVQQSLAPLAHTFKLQGPWQQGCCNFSDIASEFWTGLWPGPPTQRGIARTACADQRRQSQWRGWQCKPEESHWQPSSWSDSKLLLHPNWRATISNIPVRTQDWVTVFSAESHWQLHKKDDLRCCILVTIIATTASALALVQVGRPAAPAAGPGPAR